MQPGAQRFVAVVPAVALSALAPDAVPPPAETGRPPEDGRWLAFFTRESGTGEIELIRPTTPGRRIRVSQGAEGRAPRWRGDAGELFYVAADGWMTAITVGSGDPPALGAPQPLIRVDLSVEDGFDVTSDGQRFLLAGTPPSSALPVTVVLDWQAELPEY